MGNVQNAIIIMLSCLILGACVSLNDFQKMSSDERSHYICIRDNHVVQMRKKVKSNKIKIEEIDFVLARGYRLHRSCKEVPIVKPGNISCSTYGRNTDCYQSSTTLYKEVCEDKPVPISYELEKSNKDKYSSLMDSALIEENKLYKKCYSLVLPMTAEEAYSYYK